MSEFHISFFNQNVGKDRGDTLLEDGSNDDDNEIDKDDSSHVKAEVVKYKPVYAWWMGFTNFVHPLVMP